MSIKEYLDNQSFYEDLFINPSNNKFDFKHMASAILNEYGLGRGEDGIDRLFNAEYLAQSGDMITSLNQYIFPQILYSMFVSKDLTIIKSLTGIKYDYKPEKLVKFVGFLKLIQFFNSSHIYNGRHSTTDMWDMIDRADITNDVFVSFHLTHWLYHSKGRVPTKNALSMYAVRDTLLEHKRQLETIEFIECANKMFLEVLSKGYFDDCLKEYFGYQLKRLKSVKGDTDNDKLDSFRTLLINSNPAHYNLLVERLDDINFFPEDIR